MSTTTERPAFELLEGCLAVATQSEQEFLEGFEEYFWVLIHSEFKDLVVDFSASKGLDLTAYQMVALNLFEINPSKRLTLRIPEKWTKFFSQAMLYRKFDVEVVRFLGQDRDVAEQDGEDEEADESQEHSQQVTDLLSQLEQLPSDSQEAEVVSAQAREAIDKLRHTPSSGMARPSSPSRMASSGKERILQGEGGESPAASEDALKRTGEGELQDVRSGAKYPLPAADEKPFHIGRVPDNEMQVASPLISRRHCVLRRRGGRYEIMDLGSGNGTYVNGKRLEANQAKTIFHGDRIALAITRQFPQGAKVYVFQQQET